MAALKGSEIDTYVSRPDAARPIALVYGPDAGLVRERVEALVKASVDDPNDPFALVRLDGDAVEAGRIAEEAHTVPLFGGRRAVWIRAGRSNLAGAIEALAADPPRDCRVVVEAGDLRKDSALRLVCEKARNAVALPCYVDGDADLGRLIDQEMKAAGLTVADDARTLLVSLLGGDRQASRAELRKLALYGHGRGRVEVDDVLAVIADASALALDDVIDAVFAGKPKDFDTEYARARSAGTHPDRLITTALRHAAQLHRARLAVDAGRTAQDAVREGFRGLFFRREPAVRAALSTWTTPRLGQTVTDLAEAAAAVRRQADLADALAHRALLQTTVRARQKR
ncbi:DNA polymerase III subunit delta [Rhodoplanes roseus]|uniref:DNA polymerase III subunit delta n=1 Tax=Rhodoplanes roseus TaxID=29409 RepID=A0A327KQE7_9BRAD|nr:DNA polymerase III subunit delta [Rhodoplanes roseus]RAI40651.1 DNA polymerase III subunit delta [Rhodoplanes roseus]